MRETEKITGVGKSHFDGVLKRIMQIVIVTPFSLCKSLASYA